MPSTFKCRKCQLILNTWDMDMRQKTATCKSCAPEYPDERITGPWLTASGLPVARSERAE